MPRFTELWLIQRLLLSYQEFDLSAWNVLPLCFSGSIAGVLPHLINSPFHAVLWLLLLTSLMALPHCTVTLVIGLSTRVSFWEWRSCLIRCCIQVPDTLCMPHGWYSRNIQWINEVSKWTNRWAPYCLTFEIVNIIFHYFWLSVLLESDLISRVDMSGFPICSYCVGVKSDTQYFSLIAVSKWFC